MTNYCCPFRKKKLSQVIDLICDAMDARIDQQEKELSARDTVIVELKKEVSALSAVSDQQRKEVTAISAKMDQQDKMLSAIDVKTSDLAAVIDQQRKERSKQAPSMLKMIPECRVTHLTIYSSWFRLNS